MTDTYGLVPGRKLWSNCRVSFTKPEEPEEANMDSDFQDTSVEWERLNTNVAGFGCSPLKFVSNWDKVGYGKRKLEQFCAEVKDKVVIALDLETMVCNTNNRDCILHSCDQCRGTRALKERLESIFDEYGKEHIKLIQRKKDENKTPSHKNKLRFNRDKLCKLISI